MRQALKNARRAAGLTQQQAADRLGITLRYYKDIESGVKLGAIDLWDMLEDLFGIHQRELRRDTKDSQS
jgi:transcriptional regulator with XRE-family HTH domain|nr:MAG TPA: Helix-turn-helix XRE-family like protein [Caudoviricetes sp.]